MVTFTHCERNRPLPRPTSSASIMPPALTKPETSMGPFGLKASDNSAGRPFCRLGIEVGAIYSVSTFILELEISFRVRLEADNGGAHA